MGSLGKTGPGPTKLELYKKNDQTWRLKLTIKRRSTVPESLKVYEATRRQPRMIDMIDMITSRSETARAR